MFKDLRMRKVNNLIDEARFIEDLFRENFSIKEKLVIYGLGKNTKAILERCPEYNIVGLMDRIRTGDVEWGLPILSIDEVYALGVKKILVLATSANVPIIYRRIEDRCKELDIDVYDINGERIYSFDGEYHMDKFYAACTTERLMKLIDTCDVISFDIFDTLLGRDVLFPTDIFEIIELQNKKYIPKEINFTDVRISCEHRLYALKNPTIYDIYDEIKKETNMSEECISRLCNAEIMEEKRSLFARNCMQEIVEYALKRGKKVCCTSDMYLTKEILMNILKEAGYMEFDNIFVSCEHGVSKNNGLYEVVKEKYLGKKILHIGDNYDADIVSAKRYAIDETFQIASIYKMLSDSTMRKILQHDIRLDDRCELGRLFFRLFNNPFLFAVTKGKCEVSDNYNLGYFFIEPMIASFIEWMLTCCKRDSIDTVLLGSRDGFIIQKMLDIRKKYINDTISYKYFYASRYACTLAGLKTEDDVKYVFQMAFDGSAEDLLTKRFELKDEDLIKKEDGESKEDYLKKHIPLILSRARIYRNKYRNYFERSNIFEKNIGFLDFVSSGTCQLWLENIWPEAEWTGFYFIKNLDIYKDKLNIQSYFEPRYVYEKQSKLYKNYIFMENIMTSFEPTLHGFLDIGVEQFEMETRNSLQLENLAEVHKGILDAYEKRMAVGGGTASRDLVDDILDLLNPKYSIMKANFFEDNILEDTFCNRKFDLKKMMVNV